MIHLGLIRINVLRNNSTNFRARGCGYLTEAKMKAFVYSGPGKHRFTLEKSFDAYDTFSVAAKTNALKVLIEG